MDTMLQYYLPAHPPLYCFAALELAKIYDGIQLRRDGEPRRDSEQKNTIGRILRRLSGEPFATLGPASVSEAIGHSEVASKLTTPLSARPNVGAADSAA
jgi:hypothetical protein